jgi:hypothetical protein
MLAIESATLATPAPLPSPEATAKKTLREELYADGFRANDRSANSLGKKPAQQAKT